MPNFREHCEISTKRTGENFSELHKWMDAPQKELGVKHRGERHDSSWMNYVGKRWGTEGIKEFLYHIEIDHQKTRKKIEANEAKKKISEQVEQIKRDEKINEFGCPGCGCTFYGNYNGWKVCIECHSIWK